MSIRFDGRVVVVTGAGAGLGRAYALGFAARGAKVVVNDLGVGLDGRGQSSAAAREVVEQIRAAGGEAIADGADVSDAQQVAGMVQQATETWGRVDVLVNNAGILRDRTFAKLSLDDFKAVLDVHLMGAVNSCKAVWEIMRAQGYGRIVLTSSSSGLYGNFGQSNYGAAKMGLIGLMNVLHEEGRKYDIRVNALAPCAATRMTDGLLSEDLWARLTPDSITPGVLFLASEDAPSRTILGAGAGAFAVAKIVETEGVYFPEADRSPEALARRFAEIRGAAATELERGAEQTLRYVALAEAHEAA